MIHTSTPGLMLNTGAGNQGISFDPNSVMESYLNLKVSKLSASHTGLCFSIFK